MPLTRKQILRGLVFVVAIGAGLSLASCRDGSASAQGNVRGTLRVIGGPPPGVNAAIAGTVTATATDGRTWRQQVTAKQPFAFSLPPGTYMFTGTSPAINDGKQTCVGRSSITVHAGGTTETAVICDIP